ncbi:low temperature requirement protein A, partial [Streptomyces sp. NPDC054796]
MNDLRHTREPGAQAVSRRLIPMTGRDPEEHGRASSPLELLFDLTFVVAVGTAASQFAEMVAEGHAGQAVIAFVLAMFAISVAWISFSWFASAFATDDWLYRALTMVQMTGVVVFSLGLPAMFHSVEEGGHLELRAMVIGHVVMRIAMVLQWWRVARQAPSFHDVSMANIRWTLIAQAGWIVVAFAHLPIAAAFVAFTILGALELVLPVFTQGFAGGTPWHPHHVAERYGLFAIITLGEGVVGTVASSGDLLGGGDGTHWTWNATAVVIAGVGLTFGMWWVY